MTKLFCKDDYTLPDIRGNWRKAWSSLSFRVELIVSFLLNIALVQFVNWYFPFIQTREGSLINDPILNLIQPRDLSWWTFGFEYFAVIVGLTYVAFRPKQMVLLFETVFLITSTRMCTLYFIPLEPPIGLIPLADPILGRFVYSGNLITKDLFFSGHTVMVFIMFLNVRHIWLKIIFLLLTISVGAFVVIQHVHYSFDVLVAPFFTWIAYKIVDTAHQ